MQNRRNLKPCVRLSCLVRLAFLCLAVIGPVVVGPVITSPIKNSPHFTTFYLPSRAFAQTSNNSTSGSKVYIPFVLRSQPPSPPAVEWLQSINDYRAMANLPPVVENPAWSSGGQAHSVYIVKNDVLTHNEDPTNPWYTAEGQKAAQSSNLMACSNEDNSDRQAIDSWIQAPFHAVGILDPALQTVGFGSYREADGGLQMSAVLDVLRGMGEIPAVTTFPILFPGNGAATPIGAFLGGETPDPLTSCPGYSTPSGLPVILELGAGNLSPSVQAYSFSQGSTLLESCVFTESTYSNPNRALQDLGRAILNERDAVVLIPRQPLTPGETYSVSMTLGGQTYHWSFSVANTAQQFQVRPTNLEVDTRILGTPLP